MKKIVVLLICLLLCGCASNNANLDDAFIQENKDLNLRPNNSLTYYKYYLPSDVYEQDYEENAVLLKYEESTISMNLNVASIINSEFYNDYYLKDDGFFDDYHLFYEHTGTYLDIDNNHVEYFYRVYEYENEYIVHMMSEKINFYAYTIKKNLFDLSEKMLIIAKSISVNDIDVISNYSSKSIIDYQKKQINLFDLVLPVNGKLDELILDN